jgi:hypothetical protein
MSNRLETIVTRQRFSRIRDLVFVAIIGVVSAVSINSVGAAVDNAAVKVATR